MLSDGGRNSNQEVDLLATHQHPQNRSTKRKLKPTAAKAAQNNGAAASAVPPRQKASALRQPNKSKLTNSVQSILAAPLLVDGDSDSAH